MENITNSTISQGPQPSLPDASKLFSSSFSFYKQHFAVIAGISAVPFIFSGVLIFANKTLSDSVFLILTILTVVVSLLSYLALFYAVVKEEQSVGNAYKKSLPLFFPFIWVNILITLAVMGGTFLLIIPGILLSIWLSLSMYVFFAENRRGISALVSSWHYANGYLGAIFWRGLFLGLIILLISVVLTILTGGPATFTAIKSGVEPETSLINQLLDLILDNFFILPITIIYSFGVYRSLKEIKASAPLESDEKKIKKKIIIFSVIGIVGILAIIALAGLTLVKLLPLLPDISPTSYEIPASQ